MYKIMVEYWNEDIDVIDEYKTLEEAIGQAKSIAYKYKCIWIEQVDKKDNFIKEWEIE